MGKIISQVRNKKQFINQIVSDGVSVTVLYDQPKRETVPPSNEQIRQRLSAGEFSYILGIDPGMRTWNAAVRYNYNTGEEVIFEKKKNSLFMN